MGGRRDFDDDTTPSGRPLARPDPLIGTMLGEYRVVAELGRGGMGVVYRGEQPVIGRPVAIKVMAPEAAILDPSSDQRMLDEARAANAVRHPNIIDIFSFGELPDGRPYMVMELLQGRSLANLLSDNGPLTWKQLRLVLDESLLALEAAHAQGVVHRDLKPDNIFISEGEGGWRIKLIDFGLARRVREADRRLTRPGMVMGTPGYMAPEQVRGEERITRKADIYALGLVGWTALMGREPFEGGALIDVLNRHLSSPLPKLDGSSPLPEGAEELLRRMSQKEPDARPEASEARAALARLDEAAAPRSRAGLWLGLGAAALALVATFALVRPPDDPVVAPLARPLPVPVKPVVVPAPEPAPVVPEPEPAPPAVEPPPEVPGYPQTVACSDVVEVTPVLLDYFAKKYVFVSISLMRGSSLIVYADNTKKPKVKALRDLRESLAACRGAARIAARNVDTRHTPFHTDFVTAYGGDVVEVADVIIVPAP
ncbi:MAG: serine/threonine protein kinase [Myxococcaceae bacterium]|nr:serine/threonine protein kinase [Myxococcaceae bacterium]